MHRSIVASLALVIPSLMVCSCAEDASPTTPSATANTRPASTQVRSRGTAQPAPLAPVMDGDFGDWSIVQASVSDPIGDGKGAFDITSLEAIASNGRLALRLGLAQPLNLQAGPGSQGTLIFTIASSSAPERAVSINLRSRQVNGESNVRTWEAIDYVSAPTVASTQFEMSIDARRIGADIGDDVTVSITGSDSLSTPLVVRQEKGPNVARAFQHPSKGKGVLRVCSVNTLRTGSEEPQRAPELARLIDAMDADIVCLQEEYNSFEGDLADWLTEIDPLEDGRTWQALKFSSNVILAPVGTEIIIVPESDGRYVMAVLDTGDGALLVGSVHLKCCGHAGSSEDNQRIGQAQSMRQTIYNLRSAELGSEFKDYTDVPFLLVGDWNLVGSGGARDTFTQDQALGAVDLAPMRMRSDRNTTWRDLTPSPGGFPPGRLDLVVASDTLDVQRSFVFDTADLDADTLVSMGLDADTSEASDHLMLVVDINAN